MFLLAAVKVPAVQILQVATFALRQERARLEVRSQFLQVRLFQMPFCECNRIFPLQQLEVFPWEMLVFVVQPALLQAVIWQFYLSLPSSYNVLPLLLWETKNRVFFAIKECYLSKHPIDMLLLQLDHNLLEQIDMLVQLLPAELLQHKRCELALIATELPSIEIVLFEYCWKGTDYLFV